jgi:plasmid stability protein
MNLTIKDLPKRLHQKLRTQAQTNKRSLNWEVIDLLEKAVESTPVDSEKLLAEIRRVRLGIHAGPLTGEFLRQAKNEGRP